MARRAAFEWIKHDNGVVAIIDMDAPGSRSVTNDIEDVIDDVHAGLIADGVPGGVEDVRVIYRDSSGVWDGVMTRAGRFFSFVLIGTRSAIAAQTFALGCDREAWARVGDEFREESQR